MLGFCQLGHSVALCQTSLIEAGLVLVSVVSWQSVWGLALLRDDSGYWTSRLIIQQASLGLFIQWRQIPRRLLEMGKAS